MADAVLAPRTLVLRRRSSGAPVAVVVTIPVTFQLQEQP